MDTTIKIPWAKPDIGKEEFDEIKNSFENNWFTLGPKVKLFENYPSTVALTFSQ